ncbi:MAG: J domain-containing protein [Desulfobulbaceae bacterium]|nr:J domain-containing protein [Desulfobulbaceae bacterium]
MPGNLYIPRQVLQSIREHIDTAVKHAESGYSSAQEEEDTITGELCGALRTKGVKVVEVNDEEIRGPWRWSITYSKFRSKAKHATESILGADGILQIHIGSSQKEQQKSALFQAKIAGKVDPRLVGQCAKMSVWREAAFVISYSANGYRAFSIDDILQSRGSISEAENGQPFANWIIESFIGCRIGHPSLYYEKDQRRLYWQREMSFVGEASSERWVWVDFRPAYLIQLNVTPPDWERSGAVKITSKKIPLNRLTFTSEDLFGIKAPFTLKELKKRKAQLLHSYHPDKNHQLEKNEQSLLDNRIIEINQAFIELSSKVAVIIKQRERPKSPMNKVSPSRIDEPKTDSFDFSFKQKVKEKDSIEVRLGKKPC